MSTLRVRDILDQKGAPLHLAALTDEVGLDREVTVGEVASPGLVLAGYTARFAPGRVHVLGETEISYLSALEPAARRAALESFFGFDVPCVFVTKAQKVPADLVEIARRRGVAVIRSALKTAEFYRRIKPFLEEAFAPHTTMHGSLADVYGVGLLFLGRSGVGKSECVLDLVERGHRLVADDLVIVRRLGNEVLIGRGHEDQHHVMEIRGIGLVDVAAIFGIRAVRQRKRIEVVVKLTDWESGVPYERTGLDREEIEVLDVRLPQVTIPLNPGKNITVICEVVAMSHLLAYSGVNVAQAFNERLISRMQERRAIREYLEEDYE